jgi:hypothetical protein
LAFAGGSREAGSRFDGGDSACAAGGGGGALSVAGTPSVSSSEFQRSDFPGSDIGEAKREVMVVDKRSIYRAFELRKVFVLRAGAGESRHDAYNTGGFSQRKDAHGFSHPFPRE